VSDSLRLIQSFHEKKRHENLAQSQRQVRDLYLSLSPEDVDQAVRTALDLLASDERTAGNMLRCLACFRPGCLGAAHHTLVERRFFYPGIVYYGAEDGIAKRILSLLSDKENVNHMLLALAWIGNETVQKAFQAWKKKPPDWTRQLHVPPHRYAEEAGWALTPRGKRRELYSSTCHPLVPPTDDGAVPGVVRIGGEVEEACHWCERPLTVFLDLDLSRQASSFLNISGKRLRILTCHVCTCFGCVYTALDWNGKATWHKENEKPSYLPENSSTWDKFPLNPLAYSEIPRHALEGANWLLPGVAFSQIGGFPTWIQDAHYPPCLGCGSPVPFLAQLSNEDYRECGEQ
jgi:hypothetical protein